MADSSNPDVPVLIETLARPFFPMVRCHYLAIEYDSPQPGWRITLGGMQSPFLMIGLAGVVLQPFEGEEFDHPLLIDQLFELVEETAQAGLLNFEDIWLPGFLFPKGQVVGDVYRVGWKLFSFAFLYREGRIDQDNFEVLCRELQREIRYSGGETTSFHAWAGYQVRRAETIEPKNLHLRLRTKGDHS